MPILLKYNILNSSEIKEFLNKCSYKSIMTVDGKRVTRYNFSKIRSLI